MYLFAGGETALAQRCLYRAKVLLLTVHGRDHPYTAVIDVNIIKHNQVITDPKKKFSMMMFISVSPSGFSGIGSSGRTIITVSTERTETQQLLQRRHRPDNSSDVRQDALLVKTNGVV